MYAIHPELPWDEGLRQALHDLDHEAIDPAWGLPPQFDHLTHRQTLGYLIWLGALPPTLITTIASRLRFKAELRDLLLAASRLHQALPGLAEAKPSAVVHACESIPRLAIYAAYLISPNRAVREKLWLYASRWAEIRPKTTGYSLRQMGLRPSPAYGQILSHLRDAWVDGEIHTVDEEFALRAKLVAEAQETL